MLHKTLHYLSHRLATSKDIRLAMTLLVKNEQDIIADNIHFHAKQGIDCFIVMDNGSTDGTREILDTLFAQYDMLIIDQPDQNYQQAKWMTELAFIARDKMGAGLVVSNDADEFWRTQSGGSLKEHLLASDSVVTVPRYNMALPESAKDDNYHFSQSDLVVKNPILFNKDTQINEPGISMLLIKISPQTIVNPYGLIKLKGGNHRAKHGWRHINKRNENNINVFHYPIRSYKQFEANIENRVRLLELTNARMGDHYRRWVKLYKAGELEKEFERFLLNNRDIDTLSKVGVISRMNPFD